MADRDGGQIKTTNAYGRRRTDEGVRTEADRLDDGVRTEITTLIFKGGQKKTLFHDAEKFASRIGADVGVVLFSPGEKPCSYGSSSIEEIIENFLKVKQEDRQCGYAEGKSNNFKALEDLNKKLQTCNEKGKKRVLMHKNMHPGSETPQDKHMEEQKLALKLRVEMIKKETQSSIWSSI
ncbi:agamous-like MADS-box protein AGL61 [Solanum pennellii]|uniref:Agamous-like MADS-box protein AGL61 n=1 Tax=Solanum pennellii TaxID=28526 RepID=A0ABM1G1H9_SOLPN|nr:agamous-like MADS-box protein AGL61 [Solanum pennellii]